MSDQTSRLDRHFTKKSRKSGKSRSSSSASTSRFDRYVPADNAATGLPMRLNDKNTLVDLRSVKERDLYPRGTVGIALVD